MQGNPLHGQNVNANLMADNLYACQVTFAQLLNFPPSPVSFSVCVCVCVRFVHAKVTGCVLLGVDKGKSSKVPSGCQTFAPSAHPKSNRAEWNGTKRNAKPNSHHQGWGLQYIDIAMDKTIA